MNLIERASLFALNRIDPETAHGLALKGLSSGLAPLPGPVTSPRLATTLAGWVMVVQLMRGARPLGDVARFDARFWSRLWRICLVSAVMGAVLWLGALALEEPLRTAYWRYPALALLVVAGIVVYFGLGQIIGAVKLSEFRRPLKG